MKVEVDAGLLLEILRDGFSLGLGTREKVREAINSAKKERTVEGQEDVIKQTLEALRFAREGVDMLEALVDGVFQGFGDHLDSTIALLKGDTDAAGE